MISMAIAAPRLPFLPLVAKQILLNNFLSDLPSMAISTDRVDPERVTHPQRWDITQVRRYMIVFGLVSSIFDLLTFAALRLLFRAGEATFQTTWFVVSLLTELGVVLILRTRGPVWRSRPSTLLLWTTPRGHSVHPRHSVPRVWVQAVRLCAALDGGDGRHRRDGCDLPGSHGNDEALVLLPQG
jgi:magnesium-transporting ATPase (P-type)